MKRITLALCLTNVAACTSENTIETVYDPCSPLTVSVEPGIADAELAGVEGAIAAWSHVLPTAIEVGSGPQAYDVLPIRFEPGDTFYRAVYWDAFGEIAISRDRLLATDYAIAIAHEMGHAFGLLHVEKRERGSIMNVGNLEIAPTTDDAAAVRALWAACRAAAE